MNKVKFIIIMLVLFSCDNKTISTHTFNTNEWDFRDSVRFSFNITDTISNYKLSFFIRNTLDYEYRNIFLLINTNYNNMSLVQDTLEYPITTKAGEWLGSGLGEMKDNYLIFNENLSFNKVGEYELIARHGMRSNPLVGINKFGFKLEEL